jgi:hypothetical protein
MVIVDWGNVALCCGEEASFTCTVKLNVPVAVGVPVKVITLPLPKAMVIPVGSAPVEMLTV